MKNNKQTKKQWHAPQIIDLDVKETKSGKASSSVETSIVATSYAPTS